jgi:endonuclease YncB( thermonuclease family)
MATPNKAVFQLGSLTAAISQLSLRPNGTRASVPVAVHDGDTISVDPKGNLGVRFLGVDAPETTAQLPGEKPFRSVGGPEWEAFLTDPFAAAIPPFIPPLPAGIRTHLDTVTTPPGCAVNHRMHALAAAKALEAMVQADVDTDPGGVDTFEFFIAFSHEILDRYGRFLGYIHRNDPVGKPPSYNEQLLTQGLVSPYFIWPNIDPFLHKSSLVEAVPSPGQPITSPKLDAARAAVTQARANQLGIFADMTPLRLEPFELRFLARLNAAKTARSGPDRWVIDMSAADDVLHQPMNYHEIPNSEDRLFVPQEYVPLFVEHGWQKEP